MKNTFIILAILLLLSACKEEIVHDLSEKDGNHLLTHLHEIGITAEKAKQPDGKWAIAVSKEQVIPALSALSDARIFRRSSVETKKNSSMLPSREAQRFEFERAVSQEIESTLAALSGVLEARVHLHLPTTDPLFGRSLNSEFVSSASVLIISSQEFREKVESIKLLVSGASGIKTDRIGVILSPASRPGEESINTQIGLAEKSQLLPSKTPVEAKPVSDSTEVFQPISFKKSTSAVPRVLLFALAVALLIAGVATVFIAAEKKNYLKLPSIFTNKQATKNSFEAQLADISLNKEFSNV